MELDIQGALSSGAFTVARDLLFKIKALNIVRSVLDKKPLYQYSFSSVKNIEIFIWVSTIKYKRWANEKEITLIPMNMGVCEPSPYGIELLKKKNVQLVLH